MSKVQDLKNLKKSRFRKIRWFLAGWAVLFVCFVLLLLHRPACYNPPKAIYGKQVSPYLTHVLLPRLYNGAQRQEPFELVVTQKGISDIIARSKPLKGSDGGGFSRLQAFFVPDGIVFMGTASVCGAKLVVTVVAEPVVDEGGLLNLRMAKVKIGAVNVTFLVRMMAGRMYKRQIGRTGIDTEALRAKIAASLLNDEPFEPVLKIEDKKIRVKKITVKQEKLTIRFVPASD